MYLIHTHTDMDSRNGHRIHSNGFACISYTHTDIDSRNGHRIHSNGFACISYTHTDMDSRNGHRIHSNGFACILNKNNFKTACPDRACDLSGSLRDPSHKSLARAQSSDTHASTHTRAHARAAQIGTDIHIYRTDCPCPMYRPSDMPKVQSCLLCCTGVCEKGSLGESRCTRWATPS